MHVNTYTHTYYSQQTKIAEEALDKAIQHKDRLLESSLSIELNISTELNTINNELKSYTLILRKIQEKEHEMNNKKEKIDCDLPEKTENEINETAKLKLIYIVDEEDIIEKNMITNKKPVILSKKNILDERLRVNNEIKNKQQLSLIRLYMQRVHINPVESKKIIAVSTSSTQSLRARTLVQLQCIISNCYIDQKDILNIFTVLIKDLKTAYDTNISNANTNNNGSSKTTNNTSSNSSSSTSGEVMSDSMIVECLLDICRVAWQCQYKDIALECTEMVITIYMYVCIYMDLHV